MADEVPKISLEDTEAIMARWAAEAEAKKKKEADAKAAVEKEGALQEGAKALTGGTRTSDMLKRIEH